MKLESNRIYKNLANAMKAHNHLNNAIANRGGNVHPSEYTRLSALNNKVQKIFKTYRNALNKEKRNLGKVATIHQLGSILPRNVLEQVIRRANLLN
jgi:hypothetical protein